MPPQDTSAEQDAPELSRKAARRELLRARLQAGIDALDRGAFTEVSDDELDAALDNLVPVEVR